MNNPQFLRTAAILAVCLHRQIADSSRFGGRQGVVHLLPVFGLWKKAEMTGKPLPLAQIIWAFERLGSYYPSPEKPGFFRRGTMRATTMWVARTIVELANSGQFDILTAAWEWLWSPEEAEKHIGRNYV